MEMSRRVVSAKLGSPGSSSSVSHLDRHRSFILLLPVAASSLASPRLLHSLVATASVAKHPFDFSSERERSGLALISFHHTLLISVRWRRAKWSDGIAPLGLASSSCDPRSLLIPLPRENTDSHTRNNTHVHCITYALSLYIPTTCSQYLIHRVLAFENQSSEAHPHLDYKLEAPS